MHPRKPHRLRLVSLVCFGVSASAIWLAIGRRSTIELSSGWYLKLQQGEARIGQSTPPHSPLAPLSWDVSSFWIDNANMAWRPYRASEGPGDAGVAIPLWLPTIASAVTAAFAHGYVLALRRRSDLRCPSCHYPTLNVPVLDGVRTCPECGRRERLDGSLLLA